MIPKPVIESIDGLTIKVNDRDKTRTFKLGDLFSIDESNLSVEYAQQASLYAYFGAMQAKADFDANLVETGLEQEQASADSDARVRLQKRDVKFTEAVIKGMVTLDEECAKLQGSLIEYRYDAKVLGVICKAFEMRAQMLISLGSHLRHEMDQTGMKIKERQFEGAIEETKKVLAARPKK